MFTRRPFRLVGLVAISATLFGAACGSVDTHGTAAKHIKQLPTTEIVGPFLGLVPKRENVKSTLSDQQANSYVDAVGLYSLRKGDRLEATLQINHLSKLARPKKKAFRDSVADQVGGTKAQAFVMGGHDVYRSSLRKQSLTTWFRGDYFFVLSVRDTYPTPRSLLRVLLNEVTP